MQEFDKLPNNIIVLAATNRLDILDDAFISRFSIKRKINPFTEEQNKKMIHLFSENEINTIIGSTHSQKEIINRIRRFKCEKIYYLIFIWQIYYKCLLRIYESNHFVKLIFNILCRFCNCKPFLRCFFKACWHIISYSFHRFYNLVRRNNTLYSCH